MLRLLIALAVIGLIMSFLWQRQAGDAPPEIRYHEQMDKAEALEQQLQQGLEQRSREIDRQSE